MKRLLAFLLLSVSFLTTSAQCLTAFRDTRDTREDFFYVFDNDLLKQQEFQKIQSYQVGSKYIAYVDFGSAFKVYIDGRTVKLQDSPPVEYYATDYLLVYKNAGDQMFAFDGKEVHSLGRIDPNYPRFAYGDSIVAFNDYLGAFILFYNGEITTFTNRFVTQFLGAENIVAFISTDYEYDIFYNGKIITLETGSAPQTFQIHNNIVAYVDFVGDFKVFHNGEVVTLQTIAPISYKVGEDMVAYVSDIENKFMVYYDGNEYELMPIAPKKYEIVDNMLVYFDQNNHMHAFYKGKDQKLTTYEPFSYMIDRNIVVYTDLDKRVLGFINGISQKVSGEVVDSYYLRNTSVLFQRVKSTMKVYCDGRVTQLY